MASTVLAALALIAVVACSITLLLVRRIDGAPVRQWSIALIGCGVFALYQGITPLPTASLLRMADVALGLAGLLIGVAVLRAGQTA